MLKVYNTEAEGQIEFYNDYLKVVDRTLELDDILMDNNDGVVNGNILEFKLNINNVSEVLSQTIKYLSSRRIKGKPIPANILLVSLNDSKVYYYKSIDYLEDIEEVYVGVASKMNREFQHEDAIEVLEYDKNELDEVDLIKLLRSNDYTKINIDENNIVGWARNYYTSFPNATKADFIGDLDSKVKIIGEIRQPTEFKEYIHPYEHKTNIKFNYLMDKLNVDLQQKNLGAFFTPTLYAKHSLSLVREAINRVPEGNDYVIIDRCAGTGNLEKYMTEDELSHVIVSTLEYYEYKVLLEILGDKVRHVIPPKDKEDTFNMGLVNKADALSKDFLENKTIEQYLNNPNCTIILFENPPYAEVNGITRNNSGRAIWKNSYVVDEMKKDVSARITNDLGSVFIWSAFKYYLRQPTDSYIVYSPVKYWKAQHLVNKKFLNGYAYNRKHFHTKTNACIMCALWSNEDSEENEIELKAFDIKDDMLVDEGSLAVKRIYSTLVKKYSDRTDAKDDTLDGIAVELNGKESFKTDKQIRVKKKYNDDIVGFLVANGSGFDNPRLNAGLTIAGRYDGNGFFIREQDYLKKLPLFAASRYTDHENDWKIMSFIMKSGDKSEKYEEDVKSGKLDTFLLKNLFWTSLSRYPHMRSFKATDGRLYRNNICLDKTNGDTLASEQLKNLKMNDKEKNLLKQWNRVIDTARNTKNYDNDLTYGVYQIDEELNTYKRVKVRGRNKTEYDYPDLNGYLVTLKALVKKYYLEEIVPTLFEYEFLK